jgi:hypothetical protein
MGWGVDKTYPFYPRRKMNGLWDILSVAIGISFIFMILSILNSWVQELISTWFGLRTRNLANILQNMLEPDAKKLNGLLKVKTPYSDRDGDVRLLPGLRRQSAEKYYPIEPEVSILEEPAIGCTKLERWGIMWPLHQQKSWKMMRVYGSSSSLMEIRRGFRGRN